MRTFLTIFLTALFFPLSGWADVAAGDAAPNFSAKGADGKTHSLEEYKGKYLVLEWFNKGCPFVRKHYNSGNMQSLQRKYTAQGVAWLTVASSAPDTQGYLDEASAKAIAQEWKSAQTAILLDSDGKIGRAFGAKTTPHMFVIDPNGKVIYAGAIDDNDSTRESTIGGAKNYVALAIDEAIGGKPVSTTSTEPYGCSVKYAS